MRRSSLLKWSSALSITGIVGTALLVSTTESAQVQVEPVAYDVVASSIVANGTFVFSSETKLSPEILGVVREVLVSEGQKVQRGDVVLRLDRRSLEAEVAAQTAAVAQARLAIREQEQHIELLQRRNRRSAELVALQLVGQESHEQVTHELALARLSLEQARQQRQRSLALLDQSEDRLAKTEIRAPISGTVVAVDIKVGETAVPSTAGIRGSELVTIADMDGLYAELTVDEADIASVATGDAVELMPSALRSQPIAGQVMRIAEVPAAAAPGAEATERRKYRVEVSLGSDASSARPGMTCRAEIRPASKAQMLVIPLAAVVDSDDAARGPYVIVVNTKNIATHRPVAVSTSNETLAGIAKGISLGERVALAPLDVLLSIGDGDAVRILP